MDEGAAAMLVCRGFPILAREIFEAVRRQAEEAAGAP
jgi:hypothetical protein